MSENLTPEERAKISVNPDGTVAVDEKDRTVFLTENETIVVEKPQPIDMPPPSNRPRKVYGGMWGPVEIGVVGAGLLVVLAALAIYMFFVRPAQNELAQNRSTRDRLEAELVSARAKYGNITSTEAQVAKLVSSVNDFEAQYLPVAANGRTALYQKLNGLIAGYGLVNTTGPDYAPLDIVEKGSENQSDAERGRARFRSFFPGAYVSMTLEGPYANLRRFIRDIETGNDFVIISAIELEPSDAKSSPQQPAAQDQNQNLTGMPNQPQTRRPQGRTVGSVVSLRMEMAAYFRRTTAEAAQPEVTQ